MPTETIYPSSGGFWRKNISLNAWDSSPYAGNGPKAGHNPYSPGAEKVAEIHEAKHYGWYTWAGLGTPRSGALITMAQLVTYVTTASPNVFTITLRGISIVPDQTPTDTLYNTAHAGTPLSTLASNNPAATSYNSGDLASIRAWVQSWISSAEPKAGRLFYDHEAPAGASAYNDNWEAAIHTSQRSYITYTYVFETPKALII